MQDSGKSNHRTATPSERKWTMMSYSAFKNEMGNLFKNANKYTPGQAGFNIWTDRMADLADKFPTFDARLENETEAM